MVTGVVSNKASAIKPKSQTLNEVSPSIEFVRWTKEQLKGLTGANSKWLGATEDLISPFRFVC